MRRVLTTLMRLAMLAILAGVAYGAWTTPASKAALAPRTGPSLQEARSWGYQLQNAEPERIAAVLDVLVIDSQQFRQSHSTLSSEMVRRFKTRPNGQPRIVLAYLSVGEAESYRYYWRAHWNAVKPAFIGAENPTWRGNYRVRYWEKGWHDIVFSSTRRSMLDAVIERVTEARTSYLDRILEAGFDGVYLDRVDAYEEWVQERPTAEADMVALVREISAYTKARVPGFLVVPQNAEELLRHSIYRRAIDAIGKEDLYFGIDHTEAENSPADVAGSISHLSRARADKLPVLVVEYVTAPEKRAAAETKARDRGYLLHFAPRQLNQSPELPLPPGTEPAAQPAPPAQTGKKG